MPAEVIVLEVDASSAVKAQQATAKGFEATEKRAKQATAAIAETTEQASQQTIRIMDRTKNSIDRIAAQAEKRASQIGKTAIERLESQRAFDLSRVAGDPRAIDRVTNAYGRLIAEQRKASADAAGFGNTLRQALQNPRGALDSLVGGLTGLPGLFAAGAAAAVGLGVGLFKIVSGMGDWAEQLQNTALATGLTREQVQLFTAAAQDQGISVHVMEEAMRGLSKMMEDTSPQAIALRQEFEKLGVQFFKVGGGAQDVERLLFDIDKAVNKIEEPMKRIAKIREIIPRASAETLKLFNGELEQTIATLRRLGVAIDENALRRMDAMNQRFDEAARKWDTWKNQAKTAIVEVIDALANMEGARGRAARGTFAGVSAALGPLGTLFGFGTQGVMAVAAEAPQAPTPKGFISLPLQIGAAAADRARGAAVMAEYHRQQEQGVAGLQTRLGKLTGERQVALGRSGAGIGEAAALAARAQLEQMDREIAAVQASIKALETQRQKAAEAAATALKVREQINLYKAQIHAAAMGAVIEIVKPEAGPGEAFERRLEFESRQFQQGQRTVPTASGARAFGLTTGAASAEMIGTQDELRNLEKVLDTVKKFDAERAQQQLQGVRREGRLQEQMISLRTGPGGEAQAIEETYRLRLEFAQKEFDIHQDIAELQERTQEAEIDRILDITRLERERFEDIRRSAEGILDELLTRSKSIGDVIQSIFRAAILTPIKQAGATLIANLLAPLYGLSRGGGVMGTLGGLGGALPALGGIGSPGAPGGTPGFAGPVGGIGALSQLGGLGGLAKGGIGGLGGLTAAGIAPGLLGLAGLGGLGAFKLGQRGGAGKVLGPALGAFSGLLGFGALSAMFPALIAAGPIGWIAAGGIGAFTGIMGALKKSAESKAKEKIQALYGVTIREKNILQQITGIAKEGFGGNLDLAIRSQPVRDLVELYSMTMTGSSLGLSNVPKPVNVMQGLGGQITPSSSWSQSPVAPMAGAAPITVVMPVQVVGARQFLTEETVNVIGRSGRVVQQSSLKAQRSNVGRRENAALQLAPTMITS